MEHPLRDHARRSFASALGEGATARNCERSVYNWAVQETRKNRDVASWENRLFRWRYKQKAFGLTQELGRAPCVTAALEVADGVVKVKLAVVPQLVLRLGRKELDAKKIAW